MSCGKRSVVALSLAFVVSVQSVFGADSSNRHSLPDQWNKTQIPTLSQSADAVSERETGREWWPLGSMSLPGADFVLRGARSAAEQLADAILESEPENIQEKSNAGFRAFLNPFRDEKGRPVPMPDQYYDFPKDDEVNEILKSYVQVPPPLPQMREEPPILTNKVDCLEAAMREAMEDSD